MRRTYRSLKVIVMLAAAGLAGGCGGILDPRPALEEFQFEEGPHGIQIATSLETQLFLGEIHILGQLNTPSACSSLSGNLNRSGSVLNLRITTRTRSTNCQQQGIGNYRYIAALRYLPTGTYELRVVHTFADGGWPDQTLSKSITVR
jgi:hypothetical protein